MSTREAATAAFMLAVRDGVTRAMKNLCNHGVDQRSVNAKEPTTEVARVELRDFLFFQAGSSFSVGLRNPFMKEPELVRADAADACKNLCALERSLNDDLDSAEKWAWCEKHARRLHDILVKCGSYPGA